jgi:MFS family permease
MTLVAPLSGRLVCRFGGRPSMFGGGAAVALSALMLTDLAPATSLPLLLLAYALFGLGFALVTPSIANTAVAGMPPAQAGVAAAVATTSRQVGITLGVAVFGALVGAAGGSTGPAFATATHAGWWTAVALGIVVAALGCLTTTPWARRTAARTAEQFGASDLPTRAGAPFGALSAEAGRASERTPPVHRPRPGPAARACRSRRSG